MKRSALMYLCVLSGFSLGGSSVLASRTGLVESPTAKNVELSVGVTYGLPGINIDLKNVKEISSHPGYRFDTTELWEEQGTVANVAQKLTDLSQSVTAEGTFFFYFSGHGSTSGVLMQDRLMKITEIREALEKGREGIGALDRLVLMFDSCYSGALLDPVRQTIDSFLLPNERANSFANSLVSELQSHNSRAAYWKKLFVFASSRADETSQAGSNGSAFTVSLRKAFDESALTKSTLGEFIAKTQKYTESKHHPVARLVPASLENEVLVP